MTQQPSILDLEKLATPGGLMLGGKTKAQRRVAAAAEERASCAGLTLTAALSELDTRDGKAALHDKKTLTRKGKRT